jgi:hypothetical protein
MGIDLHLSTCVDTQSPKYLEMVQGHISLSRLLAGDGRGTLDGCFWHFPFGIGPWLLHKISSLMYNIQIMYRD